MSGVGFVSLDKIKILTSEIAQHRQEISRLVTQRDQMLAEQGMELNLETLKTGPGAIVQARFAELTAIKAREEELTSALASARIDTKKAQNAFNGALATYSAAINQFRMDHPYANLADLPPLHKAQLETAQDTMARKNAEYTTAVATVKSLKNQRREASNALKQAMILVKEEARTNAVQPRTEETAKICQQAYSDLSARETTAREVVKQAMAGLKVAAIECKVLAIEIATNEKASSVQSTRVRDATNKAIQAAIKAHQKAIKELDKKISTEEKGIPV